MSREASTTRAMHSHRHAARSPAAAAATACSVARTAPSRRALPMLLVTAAVLLAACMQTAHAQNGVLTLLGPSQTLVDSLYTPEYVTLGSTLVSNVTLSASPSAGLTVTASCFGTAGTSDGSNSEGIVFSAVLSFAPGDTLTKTWSATATSDATQLGAGLERRCRLSLSGASASEYSVVNFLRYHVVDPTQTVRFQVAQVDQTGTDPLRVLFAPRYQVQAGATLRLSINCTGNGTVVAGADVVQWNKTDLLQTRSLAFQPRGDGSVSCDFATDSSSPFEAAFFGVPASVTWYVTGYAATTPDASSSSSTGAAASTAGDAASSSSTGGAPSRAVGESGCEWASQSYDGSPQELMDALVDVAFNGADADGSFAAVVGIFNQPMLRPIFDGTVRVRDVAVNSTAARPNWTVWGSTAQRDLLRHYSQYFGSAFLLQCSEQLIDSYEGRTDLHAVHANMPLNETVFSLFISEVASAAASVGIAGIDIRTLRSMLAGYARSSTASLLEVCSQAGCDCALGHSGVDCAATVSASTVGARASLASALLGLAAVVFLGLQR